MDNLISQFNINAQDLFTLEEEIGKGVDLNIQLDKKRKQMVLHLSVSGIYQFDSTTFSKIHNIVGEHIIKTPNTLECVIVSSFKYDDGELHFVFWVEATEPQNEVQYVENIF